MEKLARPIADGWIGPWTYRPAHFCNLRVSTCDELDVQPGEMPGTTEGMVTAWFVEGYGAVHCEPNGALNLNRYLPVPAGEAHLVRRFELREGGEVTSAFGLSDALSLELDGQEIWSGERTFQGFADRAARGYAEPGMHSLRQALAPGSHRLAATLRVREGFGWGLALAAHGEGLRWLPAEWG